MSNKKYAAQTSDLNETRKLLNTTIIEQEVLKRQLAATEDSMRKLKSGWKEEQLYTEYRLYKNSLLAGDYQNASTCLVRLLDADSTQGYWAYDSLTLYHYLYLNTSNPNSGYQSPTALYYAEKGLKIHPENTFLLEIKGKMLLIQQNDTAAFRIFNELWKRTGDYTYLWNLTYINLVVYQDVKKVEATISDVLKNAESPFKIVRVTQVEEKRVENVPAKAAFLFLRGVLQANTGQFQKALKTLEEVVKIAPGFTTARRSLQELKTAAGYR